jgi:hypothetical protein
VWNCRVGPGYPFFLVVLEGAKIQVSGRWV